jgi:hypothetical protein
MLRHRRFAHRKDCLTTKSKTSLLAVADFGSASKPLAEQLDAKCTIVPCFLSFGLAGTRAHSLVVRHDARKHLPQKEPNRSSHECNHHDRSGYCDRLLLWVPSRCSVEIIQTTLPMCNPKPIEKSPFFLQGAWTCGTHTCTPALSGRSPRGTGNPHSSFGAFR